MNLKYRVIELLRQAIISLLWFQGTRVLFARLFGVIYDTIFASNIPLTTTAVICVAVIVAFIAPIAAKLYTRTDKSARMWLDVLFVLAVITRIVLSFDGFWLQLIAAILLTGITGSFLGIIAVKHINALVPLLLVGVLLDVVFRSLGNTWDITTQPTTKHVYSIALLLVAVAIIVFDRVISRNKTIPTFENQGQFTGGAGLAIGAGLFLITILSTPNVVMRWTGVRFEIVTAATLLVLALSFQGVSFSNPIGRYSGAIGRLSQSGILLRAPWYFVAAVGSLFVAKSVEGLPSMIAYMLALLVALIGINRLNTTSYDHDSTQVDTKASATLAWGLFLFFIIQLLWAFTFT
ncbi:MAG: hypothetical protein ABFQ89_02870, partial [Chloroflexota bacterium]